MDDVRQAGALGGGEHGLGCGDVVVDERLLDEPADLGVVQHQRAAVVEGALPRAGLRQIRLDHLDLRIEAAQRLDVVGVLVDADDMKPGAALEARDEVLADEAGGTRDDDPGLAVARHVLPPFRPVSGSPA